MLGLAKDPLGETVTCPCVAVKVCSSKVLPNETTILTLSPTFAPLTKVTVDGFVVVKSVVDLSFTPLRKT